MKIGLIFACGPNGEFGNKGRIPWRCKEDLLRFRMMTEGTDVVMGRLTWDSLPKSMRPLPDRTNHVITNNKSWNEPGANRISDISELERKGPAKNKRVWVIGGAGLLSASFDRADLVVVTEVTPAKGTTIEADVFLDTKKILGPRTGVCGKGWSLLCKEELMPDVFGGEVFTWKQYIKTGS